MSVQCIVVDKQNNKKQINMNVKCEEYYKKCNFRSVKDFGLRNTWKVKDDNENRYISVFARNKGRANTENKCELPPPIDTELYFGSLLVVLHKEENKYDLEDLLPLTVEKWEKFYNNY